MRSVHLLVLIHGMWGNPGHLSELDRIIKDVQCQANAEAPEDAQLEVLVAQTNREESTYDGIDWGGERIADEIDAKAKEIERDGNKLTKFSVTGYSLGGLLARYVVGVLHQRHFFDSVKPVNFNTFATPHIGLLRYPSFFSTLASKLGPKILSRTGEQFYAVDRWSVSGRPLLEVMADPNYIFYKALLLFPHTTIYANAVNDVTVPYATSAIDSEDHFASHESNRMEIEFDPIYEPLIKSFSLPKASSSSPKKRSVRLLCAEWLRSMKPSRILPPFLTAKFPLNLVFYALLPIIVPSLITMALIRLSLSARSSRARIRRLEKDEKSRRTKLISIIAQLEKNMEDVVVDLMNEATDTSTGASTPVGEKPELLRPWVRPWASMKSKVKAKKTKPVPEQPMLTPTQLEMVASLNALPNLRKQLAFIAPTSNSHATIVCRNAKRFKLHKRGEGVLRHWADHFVR